MSGWIKIHRQITDWEWYGDMNTFRVFFHCLISANYESKTWRGITIKRGQFVCSVEKIGIEIGVSRQPVRRALKNLEKTGEIEINSTNKGTVITVCKYEDYNSSVNEAQPSNNQQSDLETTNDVTTDVAADVTPTKNRRKEEDSLTHSAEIPNPGFPEKQQVLDYCESKGWDLKSGLKFWLHFDEQKSNGDRTIGRNWHWWSRLEKWMMDEERNKQTNGKNRKYESKSNVGTTNEGKAGQYAI